MASKIEKRKRIEDLVLGVVKLMDNSKMANYKRIQAMFKTMSDSEFAKWADSMGNNLDDTIQLFYLPFEEVKITQIKDAADFLKIPLEEYIWYRDNDARGVRTKVRVPVGYAHVKRMQQLLTKKNRYAFDTSETTLKTGQVTGDSKIASVSADETFALEAISADNALKEFLGARADNQGEKNAMYKEINRDGFTTLGSISQDDDISKHTTLNTVDAYLIASGIKSDLITPNMKLSVTIKNDLLNKKE